MENLQFGAAQKVDLLPILKLYLEGIEAWKKNYDQFVDANKASRAFDTQDRTLFANSSETNDLQKSAESLFKRQIENQIEICRFYGKRWEEYLTIADCIHRCKTMADLGKMQSAFVTKMINDYTAEGKRLWEPVLDFVSKSGLPGKAE